MYAAVDSQEVSITHIILTPTLYSIRNICDNLTEKNLEFILYTILLLEIIYTYI